MFDQNMYDIMREQHINFNRQTQRLYKPGAAEQPPSVFQRAVAALRQVLSRPLTGLQQRNMTQGGALAK